ncbi:MAG TPA: hypothetical protein VFN49_04035 [Candidatus Aquilonibacter sp.]|nr:hypothetical protein [Candidatus Aquilonibacter sp.]
MRPVLCIALFALAALAAACAGGGGSAPGLPSTPIGRSTPLVYSKALMTMKIPAQPKNASAKRPAFVSPATQTVEVYAYSLSSPSPMPSASATPYAAQIFPVTTPSPCSQAADGSKTCTFDVQAPVGQDQFVVLTYAEPSPGPSSIPLAVFESGIVNVSLSSSPAPLNFTLTGLPVSVDVAVASPQPSMTPSTQIMPVGTASSPMPLALTPRDASGAAILTDTFYQPVTLAVYPTDAGVNLSLAAPSQCSPASSASGSSASITCAKDLSDVRYTYDGAVAYDSSNAVEDHIEISAQPQNSGTPQPGVVELSSATLKYPLASAGQTGSFSLTRFEHESDGSIRYILGNTGGSIVGSFNPATPTLSNAVQLPFYSTDLASDNYGDMWIPDHQSAGGTNDTNLTCFTGLSATSANSIALSGGGYPLTPFNVARDANGNIWFSAQDNSTYQNWIGYITPGPNCSVSFSSAIINVGSISEYPQALVSDQSGSPSGVWFLSETTGNLYHVTTADSAAVSTPAVSPGSFYGQALAVDGLGNIYPALASSSGASSVIDQVLQGTAAITPGQLSPLSSPIGIDVYPASGYPMTIAYADNLQIGTSMPGLGIFDSTPYGTNNLEILPIDATEGYAAFFDQHGDPWFAYADPSGAQSVMHFIRTSVWSVIMPSSYSVPFGGETIPIGISETADSGPFTVTSISDPTVAATATPWPGIDHDVLLNFTGATANSLSLTIQDRNGRTQTVSVPVSQLIGASRRRNAKISCIPSGRIDSKHPGC